MTDHPTLDAPGQEALTARVRANLACAEPEEKRMFGGTTFMVAGHMVCCVSKRGLMVRIGVAQEPKALARPHARPCEGTGRPMPGFILVSPAGVAGDDDLAGWLAMACDFVGALPPKAARGPRRE